MDKDSAQDMLVVDELRRRKVLRSTTIYAVLGWCLLQWCNIFFTSLGWPAWTVTLVLTAVVLGFPVVVALSWVFDITPQGVQRSDVEPALRLATAPHAKAASPSNPTSAHRPATTRRKRLAFTARPTAARSVPGG